MSAVVARRLTVVGGGWAGLSTAVHACQAGWQVTVCETARTLGGRARSLPAQGAWPSLDNGQHVLSGAYSATLALLQTVGVDAQTAWLRHRLDLRHTDGRGLAIPSWAQGWPRPWHVVAAIVSAQGWTWSERLALLWRCRTWQRQGFVCGPTSTVAQLCQGLPARVCQEWVEPLCLAALNTPVARASGQVWLRVLQDALFGPDSPTGRATDLLLPRVELGALLPEPAHDWLRRHGAQVLLGTRVHTLEHLTGGWRVDGQACEAVVLACPPSEAARLLQGVVWPDRHTETTAKQWQQQAQNLAPEPIATVYVQCQDAKGTPARLPGGAAMRALHSGPEAPAQFVFDRHALGGPPGVWAAVASACPGERATIEAQVLRQLAQACPGLRWQRVRTVLEKRATFACTAGLVRPDSHIVPGLAAAGDHIAGPYPATLEGAVRSGLAAVAALS